MDTKALRQKILDLAIRGKLVPQDPNDEPASVLLERIREQKKQMVKEGKLKAKDIKNDSVIFVGEDSLHYEKFADGSVKCIEDEIPFDLPEGWSWARLQSITSILTDGTHKTPQYSDDGYIFLSSRNVTSGKIDWENVMYIPETLHHELYTRLAPKVGDILLAKNGTTGVAAIVDREEVFDIYVSLALIRIVDNIVNPLYVLRAIGSSYIQNYFNSSLKGIGVPNLHLEHIRKALIPIPPCEEQNRIISRADMLLPFVEQIATDETELHHLISKTKSKILDLAIRGQLVPQNPDDEPASVLLDRIRAEKEELIRQGKIKRDKKESIIFKGDDNSYYEKISDGKCRSIEDELPFELPDGWEWCNLSMIGTTNIGLTYKPTDIDPTGTMVLRSSNIVDDAIDLNDLVRVKTKIRENQYVQLNDILICARNGSKALVGKCALIDELKEPASFGAFMAVYKTDYYKYVLHYLRSSQFRNVFDDGNSTAINQLTQDMLKRALIPFPPISEQERIVNRISELLSRLRDIEKSLS